MVYNALSYTRSVESLNKLSPMERAVQESLYWPDGTRQNCLEPPDESHDEIHLLVQTLVDQYNEDHNLLGVCSLSLYLSLFLPSTNKVVLCLVFLLVYDY